MSTIERAVLKGTILGAVEIRNIFTCQITEVGADTSELLWDVYMTDLVAAAGPLLHNSVHWYAYDVFQLNAGSWELIDEVTMDADGEGTGAALMNQGALVLLGKAAGIRHMGRKFFGALNESQTDGSLMVAGVAGALASLLTAYISPVTGIGGGSAVPGTVDKNGGFWPFVGGVVSNVLGSMRRRKPGVGI